MMPGMSGPEVVAAIRLAHPTIRVLVMSGYPREEIPQSGLLRPADAFLQKPFTPVHLAGQVHAVLGVV
jgi:CheY-like chemotaxis protein